MRVLVLKPRLESCRWPESIAPSAMAFFLFSAKIPDSQNEICIHPHHPFPTTIPWFPLALDEFVKLFLVFLWTLDYEIVRLGLHWPYLPICLHCLAQRWYTKDALKVYILNKSTSIWTHTYLQNMNSQAFVMLSTLWSNSLVSAFPAHILIFIEPI